MNKLLLITLFYITFASCAFRKKSLSTESVTQAALDTPADLYKKLNTYRLEQGNLYNQLSTGEATALNGKAKIEAQHLLENMDTFGEHSNFKTNSDGFTQYCEVVAKVMHETTNPYEYAFDLWAKDAEIQKDFLNEYTGADADCQTYSLGWVCVLMLAYK